MFFAIMMLISCVSNLLSMSQETIIDEGSSSSSVTNPSMYYSPTSLKELCLQVLAEQTMQQRDSSWWNTLDIDTNSKEKLEDCVKRAFLQLPQNILFTTLYQSIERKILLKNSKQEVILFIGISEDKTKLFAITDKCLHTWCLSNNFEHKLRRMEDINNDWYYRRHILILSAKYIHDDLLYIDWGNCGICVNFEQLIARHEIAYQPFAINTELIVVYSKATSKIKVLHCEIGTLPVIKKRIALDAIPTRFVISHDNQFVIALIPKNNKSRRSYVQAWHISDVANTDTCGWKSNYFRNVKDIHLSLDNRFCVILTEKKAFIINLQTGEVLKSLKHHVAAAQCCIMPNGQSILIYNDTIIKTFSLETGKRIRKHYGRFVHTTAVGYIFAWSACHCVLLFNDDEQLVAVCPQCTLKDKFIMLGETTLIVQRLHKTSVELWTLPALYDHITCTDLLRYITDRVPNTCSELIDMSLQNNIGQTPPKGPIVLTNKELYNVTHEHAVENNTREFAGFSDALKLLKASAQIAQAEQSKLL